MGKTKDRCVCHHDRSRPFRNARRSSDHRSGPIFENKELVETKARIVNLTQRSAIKTTPVSA